MQRVWSIYLEAVGHGQRGTSPRPGSPGQPRMVMDRSHTHSRRPSSPRSTADSTQPILPHTPTSASTMHASNSTADALSLPPTPSYLRMSHISQSESKGSPDVNANRLSAAPSLSLNYLPSKFSETILNGGLKRRKNGKGWETKRGGGREAFSANAARMPGEGDDDYDGVNGKLFGGKQGGKLRWNRFKWALFVGNSVLSIYSLLALIFCLLTWFDVWTHADVVRVGDRTELIMSTLAASTGVLTSLIGWAGIFLNNRSFLAVYTFLLWICFAFLVVPGYLAYKRKTFNLEGKINSEWSRDLGTDGRLRVQNQLKCCGYFNPFIEASVSQTCYARSILPGCKNAYLHFQRRVLTRWYAVAFVIVPVHIGIIVIGLLCSNHVTYRFGKGMMPKAYRLNLDTMAIIMDQYANQLAEQYGSGVATEALNRSKSNLQLDAMPTMPYTSGSSPPSQHAARYDALANK